MSLLALTAQELTQKCSCSLCVESLQKQRPLQVCASASKPFGLKAALPSAPGKPGRRVLGWGVGAVSRERA